MAEGELRIFLFSPRSLGEHGPSRSAYVRVADLHPDAMIVDTDAYTIMIHTVRYDNRRAQQLQEYSREEHEQDNRGRSTARKMVPS